MKTFWRYFIHFFGIIFGFLLIIKIISVFDKELRFDALYMALGLGGAVFYSFFMALFISQYVAGVQNLVFATRDEKVFGDLEKIIFSKTPKKRKEIAKGEAGNSRIIYTHKNGYLKWLTNPITIIQKENKIILEIPSGYYKEFKEIYERHL